MPWTPRQGRATTAFIVRDSLTVAGLSLGLAALVTAHLSIVYGLVWRPPRWRAPVALVTVLPGLVWAWRERMHVRAALFVLGAVAYALAAWSAFRMQ